jgi:hypothetical protein
MPVVVFDDGSVAVQLTVVVPHANAVPDAGMHAKVAVPELSVALTT